LQKHLTLEFGHERDEKRKNIFVTVFFLYGWVNAQKKKMATPGRGVSRKKRGAAREEVDVVTQRGVDEDAGEESSVVIAAKREAVLKKRQRAKAVENYVYAEFCDDVDEKGGKEDPNTAEYVRVTRQALRHMGVRVPVVRSTDSIRAQKAAACRLLLAARADVLGEDEKLPPDEETVCLAGKHPGDIPPERLIRLRVAPDKSRWRCYDALDIHRRILQSKTFAAHFSPYQRARIAKQTEFLEPILEEKVTRSNVSSDVSSSSGGGGRGGGSNTIVVKAPKVGSHLQPCEAYSKHRTVCERASPRCSYNTRTLVGDLLRRSTSHYADKECHPVIAYVRQLAAACTNPKEGGGATKSGETVGEATRRAEHLRLVLIDILTRAIHKNHRPNVDAATDTLLSGGAIAVARTDEWETKEVVAETEPPSASRSDRIVARYELELSVARMQRDLAKRLGGLEERELCQLLQLNMPWYLDDTLSMYERQWTKLRTTVHALASPFYAAAATSGEAFLELLGWNYIPLSAMRRVAKYCVYLAAEASRQVLTRTHAKPQLAWHDDADVAGIERSWTSEVAKHGVDDVNRDPLKGVSEKIDVAGEPYLRTLHLIVNSMIGTYVNVFASYGAFFLLTPGGWVMLDKIRRNPSLAAASGIFLSILLDQAGGPLTLINQLGLPSLGLSTLTKTVTEAIPFVSDKVIGFIVSDLTNGAPKLAPLLHNLRKTKQTTPA
jgi:hypothetical protein